MAEFGLLLPAFPGVSSLEMAAGLAFVGLLVVYAALVVGLLVAGQRTDARALAGFIPDCVVLFTRLRGAAGVGRRERLLLGAAIAYLAFPFDLVPDVLPVIGQLDDAVVVALVLRSVLRAAGPEAVAAQWPGPERSLGVMLRLAA